MPSKRQQKEKRKMMMRFESERLVHASEINWIKVKSIVDSIQRCHSIANVRLTKFVYLFKKVKEKSSQAELK